MIATAHDTAILFNHRDGTAKLVPYDGELDTLYDLLKVEMVDTIRLDRKHVIFVDDEGFYKQYRTGFLLTYKGRQTKFVGSGLLVGDNHGSNAALSIKFGDLKIDVLSLTYETREETDQKEGV
ncbi:hypothetical protein UFOVP572_38 [uncultured Caudovirales phage]|uniref:Uncharacterized protein n=2 Tax=uncultured Caudovirales phage TaxID=2100421 RepID=A0A6J5MXZ5_9CAUD|nr:hypothetical protein UFOVP572_38 [uncultured Caudovirales phage]